MFLLNHILFCCSIIIIYYLCYLNKNQKPLFFKLFVVYYCYMLIFTPFFRNFKSLIIKYTILGGILWRDTSKKMKKSYFKVKSSRYPTVSLAGFRSKSALTQSFLIWTQTATEIWSSTLTGKGSGLNPPWQSGPREESIRPLPSLRISKTIRSSLKILSSPATLTTASKLQWDSTTSPEAMWRNITTRHLQFKVTLRQSRCKHRKGVVRFWPLLFIVIFE